VRTLKPIAQLHRESDVLGYLQQVAVKGASRFGNLVWAWCYAVLRNFDGIHANSPDWQNQSDSMSNLLFIYLTEQLLL
jgi:hypothetical protein